MTGRDNLLDEMEAAFLGFLEPLNAGKGFEEERFARLLDLLDEFAEALQGERSIPKRALRLLVAVHPALEACAAAYQGDEKERTRDAIGPLGAAIERALLD